MAADISEWCCNCSPRKMTVENSASKRVASVRPPYALTLGDGWEINYDAKKQNTTTVKPFWQACIVSIFENMYSFEKLSTTYLYTDNLKTLYVCRLNVYHVLINNNTFNDCVYSVFLICHDFFLKCIIFRGIEIIFTNNPHNYPILSYYPYPILQLSSVAN